MTRVRLQTPALLLLVAAAMLTGCGETTTAVRPQTGFTPATRPTANGLVGIDARALQRQFGKPRLDIRDPTARKLQFSNDRCILDAYLYPPADNREPLVSYVEARAPTGAPVDANACAKILREGK
ncbi:hypothetical protein BH10PSE13_BH10PSE13_24060 [soil metagenome]